MTSLVVQITRRSALRLPRLLSAGAGPRRAFSGSRTALAQEDNKNPSLPSFSFKDITSNRRTRGILIGCFVVLACLEGAAWLKFAPKIWNSGNDDEGSGNVR